MRVAWQIVLVVVVATVVQANNPGYVEFCGHFWSAAVG